MPRDLFSPGATPAVAARGVRRYVVLGVALLLHVVVVAVVLIVPLFADDVLPKADAGKIQFVDAAFIADPPPAAPPVVRPTPAVNPNAAPVAEPDRIRDEQPRPTPQAEYVPNSLPADGDSATRLSGIGVNVGGNGPAPPPVPEPPAPRVPVHVGGAIREPVKMVNVAPIYPQIAQAAHVEGTVTIEAIIGTDGVVQQARVVSGVPLLNDAALTAVKQWRYRPTLLNNQPVAVIMSVTVNFRLQH
jgi:protein TonB